LKLQLAALTRGAKNSPSTDTMIALDIGLIAITLSEGTLGTPLPLWGE
jgi:hypothetical protein